MRACVSKSILKANREVAFVRWDYENKPRRAKKVFVNVTKFAILLMCFATVFAIVLTAGVFDTGFDSGANVAEADTSGGYVNALILSSVNASLMEEIWDDMHSNETGDYTYTINLADQGVSPSNYTSIYGWGDSNSLEFYSAGNNGSFGGHETSGHAAWSRPTVIAVLNVTTPTIFLQLASRYSIDVSFSGTLYTQNEGPVSGDRSFGMGILGSSSKTSASSYVVNDESAWCQDGGYYDLENWRDSGWITSSTTRWTGVLRNSSGSTSTLQSSMSNLALTLYRATGGNETTGIYANEVQITFTVHKTSAVPTTNASDGHAPAITAIDTELSTLTTDVTNYFAYDGENTLHNDIANSAAQFNDNDIIAGTSIRLDSAIARANSINGTYAKRLAVTITDQNVNGQPASRTSGEYFAGISTVSFGTATAGVSYNGVLSTGSGTYSAAGGGTGNVYIELTADPARDTATLVLYFQTIQMVQLLYI